MRQILDYVKNSFEKTSGHSGHRLTAFVFVALVVLLHIYFLVHAHKVGHFSDLEIILGEDLAFLALLMNLKGWSRKNADNQRINNNSSAGSP